MSQSTVHGDDVRQTEQTRSSGAIYRHGELMAVDHIDAVRAKEID